MGVLFLFSEKIATFLLLCVIFNIKRGVRMKKIISILSVLFVLAAGTCFAESDIQVVLGLSAY